MDHQLVGPDRDAAVEHMIEAEAAEVQLTHMQVDLDTLADSNQLSGELISEIRAAQKAVQDALAVAHDEADGAEERLGL